MALVGHASDTGVVSVAPDDEIVCVECGGRAHLLSFPREDGTWLPGDVVVYRCADCLDRFDVVLDDVTPD
jgi:DNA-directed RNA polymerase subunit RPC12/RpoP